MPRKICQPLEKAKFDKIVRDNKINHWLRKTRILWIIFFLAVVCLSLVVFDALSPTIPSIYFVTAGLFFGSCWGALLLFSVLFDLHKRYYLAQISGKSFAGVTDTVYLLKNMDVYYPKREPSAFLYLLSPEEFVAYQAVSVSSDCEQDGRRENSFPFITVDLGICEFAGQKVKIIWRGTFTWAKDFISFVQENILGVSANYWEIELHDEFNGRLRTFWKEELKERPLEAIKVQTIEELKQVVCQKLTAFSKVFLMPGFVVSEFEVLLEQVPETWSIKKVKS